MSTNNNHTEMSMERLQTPVALIKDNASYEERIQYFNHTDTTVRVHGEHDATISLHPTPSPEFPGKFVVRITIRWLDTASFMDGDIFKLDGDQLTQSQILVRDKVLEALEKNRAVKSLHYDYVIRKEAIGNSERMLALPNIGKVLTLENIKIETSDYDTLFRYSSVMENRIQGEVLNGAFVVGADFEPGKEIQCTVDSLKLTLTVRTFSRELFSPGVYFRLYNQIVRIALSEATLYEVTPCTKNAQVVPIAITDPDGHKWNEHTTNKEEIEMRMLSRVRAGEIAHKRNVNEVTMTHTEETNALQLKHASDLAKDKLTTQAALGELKLEQENLSAGVKASQLLGGVVLKAVGIGS